MASPNEKLAASLQHLMVLQQRGKKVIQSSEMTRTHRERLVNAGYLKEIVKGWLIPSKPSEQPGDTTAWYASMRDFVRGYCDQRFGEDWCVNPELSILLHAGCTTLPRQIQIHAPKGNRNILNLPSGTSLVDYTPADWPGKEACDIIQELRTLNLPMALVRVTPSFFQLHSDIARQALWQLPDASDLNRILLDGGHSVIAGRLAGAMRAVGRGELADEIIAVMKAAMFQVTETNPFSFTVSTEPLKLESPYAMRIRVMWEAMRQQVIDLWPTSPPAPVSVSDYLAQIDERYLADAYHSLSIEGYQVTPELIEKVRQGNWNPDGHDGDQSQKNAMAAKGYSLTHAEVKKAVERILAGENAGAIFRKEHAAWFRALFSPSVQAGLLKPSDLAGYRGHQVYIRNSQHVPLPKEALRDAMTALFDLLENETSGAVRAVLGHFIFVYIHPYMDGNGRIGRFILNAMLASGGYPWTIVTMAVRKEYMAALESASCSRDIKPFASLLYQLMTEQITNPPKPEK
jgi:hypothetical protein